MYNELYEIWKRELESAEFERIPSDFYSRMAEYLRRLKEESRMLDGKTVKSNLLKNEMQNVKRLLRQLILARYKKLVIKASEGQKIPSDCLASQEKRIYEGFLPLAEAYQRFVKSLLLGNVLEMDVKPNHKRTVVRLLRDVPAIIGADMKPYGPFKVEDVASIPIENVNILVKQGLAERAEV